MRCAVCGYPLEVEAAHDFHAPDCPWPSCECCRCEGLVHPACCSFCRSEEVA